MAKRDAVIETIERQFGSLNIHRKIEGLTGIKCKTSRRTEKNR